MNTSSITASDGTKYKDIFTLPLQKFIYKENINEVTLSSMDIKRPDYLGKTLYKKEELEDIVLMLNNIGLLQYSEAGDIIKAPTKKDIEDFYFKYRQ